MRENKDSNESTQACKNVCSWDIEDVATHLRSMRCILAPAGAVPPRIMHAVSIRRKSSIAAGLCVSPWSWSVVGRKVPACAVLWTTGSISRLGADATGHIRISPLLRFGPAQLALLVGKPYVMR